MSSPTDWSARLTARGEPLPDNPVVVQSLRHGLLHVEYRRTLDGTRFHTQPGVEIHFTVSGRGLFQVGGHRYALAAGHGLIFAGLEPHQLVANPASPFQRNVLCFDPKDFRVSAGGRSIFVLGWLPKNGALPFTLSAVEWARMDALLRQLNFENRAHPLGWKQMLLGSLLQVLAMIERSQRTLPTMGSSKRDRTDQVDLMEEVTAYIRANLSEPLDLAGTARRFKVSAEHLTRSCRIRLGRPFRQVVLLERILVAKEMLQKKDNLSITEIAFAVGFQSSSHFSRSFRKLTGVTPLTHREGLA